jgi:hypothetical protein
VGVRLAEHRRGMQDNPIPLATSPAELWEMAMSNPQMPRQLLEWAYREQQAKANKAT